MKKLIIVIVCLLSTSAFAQIKKPHITGNPLQDIQSDINDAKSGTQTVPASGAGDILSQLRAKFTADVTSDLNSALALARQVPAACTATPVNVTNISCAPADTTAIPCYQALISLNGVINSYTPPPEKPHVISDLEQLRIVARTVQSTNFKDACAPLVQDIQSQANQLVASVLGIISGAAKIGIAIP